MPRGIERLALAFQLVLAVLEELGRRAVERQHHVVARLVAGALDRLHDEAKRLVGRLRLGAKPPSSPTLVVWPASFSDFLQGVEDLRAHAHGVRDRLARRPA